MSYNHAGMPPAVRAADILKALRGRWLTPHELAEELGMSTVTTYHWLKDFAACGLAAARPRPNYGRAGRTPKEYSLAPEWVNDKTKG